MKFYTIDNALHEAINAADKPARLRVDIQAQGQFVSVFENDIIEANFYSLKEAAGGTSSRGELLINNEKLGIRNEAINVGSEVRIFFSMGEGLSYFKRFIFYINERGIQEVKGNGRKRFVYIGLYDLSAKLRKTDENRDWTSPAEFVYSVVCDKTVPHKSLVHGIAKRAELSVNDIDCATIPVTLPYVKLSKNIWAELSSLATAYRCHLECPVEKPLVFAHSPYQTEQLLDYEISYNFTGNDIFYLRKWAKAELYRNTVRLKVNMPVSLEKQEIWRYYEQPVFYDEFLQAHFPFKYPLVREIEEGKYEAKYKIKDTEGRERNVIYADEIDTKEEAENCLEYDGGAFSYSHYDVTTNHDRAILTLQKENDGDLYNASIHGRPIILDINRSCFMRDIEAVETYGTVALNTTGSYFSDYKVVRGNITLAQYEDWVCRELEERLQNRREFTVKTHRALFNARVGAKVKIQTKNEELAGVITSFSLRYKRDKAFVATFKIMEEI
jgi:hypothetical protein